MLNVGIIGAGRMGNAHAANFAKLKSAAVTAVYDIDPAKANAFKEKYPDVAIKNSAAELVEKARDRIQVVHCKDANPPAAGAVRGHETPLGKGSTHFATLLRRLLDSGFRGPLIIERELPPGPEQEHDVAEAVQFLNSLTKGL